jgi:hypothetical protein
MRLEPGNNDCAGVGRHHCLKPLQRRHLVDVDLAGATFIIMALKV